MTAEIDKSLRDTPNPGSDAAIALGCTCPRMASANRLRTAPNAAGSGRAGDALPGLIALWREPEVSDEEETEFDRGCKQTYEECADNLEAALAAHGQDDRDAYEGARHDLLDWKHRALSAESILRSLGYRGIVPTEPPSSPAGVPDALLIAGAKLANCAFNLAQCDRLTEHERRSLDESRKAWDQAQRVATTPSAPEGDGGGK